MPEKAILALEEALLASLFTQRAMVELLIKKGILKRDELEKEILSSEPKYIGIGNKKRRLFLEKRKGLKRRKKKKPVKRNRRSGKERRKKT